MKNFKIYLYLVGKVKKSKDYLKNRLILYRINRAYRSEQNSDEVGIQKINDSFRKKHSDKEEWE